MGWEYEDLFNNRITGDGSFLEEPSFIQVGKMGYRRRTTVSGPRLDAEVFPVFGRHQRGELRRAKSRITRDAQQRANDERSRIHLIQLVEANFTEKDVALGLDYAGAAPEPERVDKDIRNFIARVKRARRRAGLPELKYVYAIGGDEMPAAGYSGKRPHVHMIMNGGIDRDELEKMWGRGRANCDRLQPRDEGLGGIAVYFTRQKQDRAPKKGVDVTVQYDADYVDTYNADHGTSFRAYPESKVSIQNGGKIVVSGIPRGETLVNFIYEHGRVAFKFYVQP